MNRGKRFGRGGGGGNGGWRSGGQHNEHDDRMGGNEVKRRVTFKHQGRLGGKGPKRITDVMVRAILDDDEEMDGDVGVGGDQGGQRQFKNIKRGMRGGRRGSPPPGITKKKLQQGVSGWYHVLIPHGQKYDRDYIIRSLLEQMQPDVFIPFYYKNETNQAAFWVDDFKIATKLRNQPQNITTKWLQNDCNRSARYTASQPR